jgi:hypothetical protein
MTIAARGHGRVFFGRKYREYHGTSTRRANNSIAFCRTSLMTFEAQSLLSHAPRFLFKRVNFLVPPIRLGFLRVCLAQFI